MSGSAGTELPSLLPADGGGRIDKRSPVPYYHQLKLFILRQIEAESWAAGDRIPSESDLCRLFEVSRTTVRQAVNELQNEGYLASRKGKGTFVSGPKIVEGLVQNLCGFTEDMSKRGFKVSSLILEQAVAPAPESVAALLQVPPGSPVIRIRRIRNLDGEPVALTTTHVPESLCPGLVREDLREQSLYFLLENRYGLRIHRGRRVIGARPAGQEVARLLKVNVNSPLLVLDNVSYLEDGRPLECFQSYHRGDITQFEITIRRTGERP